MAEQTFRKDTGWGASNHDFFGEDEITVTITLAEYRELVEKNAKTEQRVNEANERANKARQEAEAAKAKLDKVLTLTSEEEETDDEF